VGCYRGSGEVRGRWRCATDATAWAAKTTVGGVRVGVAQGLDPTVWGTILAGGHLVSGWAFVGA